MDETVKESSYRAISVLVAFKVLVLWPFTPSAVLSAIARAAKKGVLIKGGRALERFGKPNYIALTKTGTIYRRQTTVLINCFPINGFDKKSF